MIMKFKDETATVSFKSDTPCFVKEISGRKCFTVRMMTPKEWDAFEEFRKRYNGRLKIEIQESNSDTRFHRWVTDVSWEPRWGQYEVLIAWRDNRVDTLYTALRVLYDKIEDTQILDGDDRLAEAIDDAEVVLDAVGR